MKKIKLFTDSSVNPQEKIGFGSFLILEEKKIKLYLIYNIGSVKTKFKIGFLTASSMATG